MLETASDREADNRPAAAGGGDGRTRRRVLDQRGHGFALVRHKRRDIHEARDLGIVAGFGDHDTAVRVSDEHGRTVELVEHLLGRHDVALEGHRRVLHDRDPVAKGAEPVVHGTPAGSVDETAVDE